MTGAEVLAALAIVLTFLLIIAFLPLVALGALAWIVGHYIKDEETEATAGDKEDRT